MTAVATVLGTAALFAAFGLLAPVLRRKRCGGGGCGGCSGDACKYRE
jgi:hypothetical protein